MAVHRVGVRDRSEEIQVRSPLGRLIVTIDDLSALVSLIETEFDKKDVVIEFDGGHIDSAEDLRTLSDNELKEIEVQSDEGFVSLSRKRAIAVGSSRFVETIYRRWARSRQASVRPATSVKLHRVAIGRAVMFMLSLAGVLYTVMMLLLMLSPADLPRQSRGGNLWNSPTSQLIPVVATSLVLTSLVMFASYRLTTRKMTLAVIVPMSLDEYRQQRILAKRHSQTVTTASVGVACTAVGILVGLLIE